MFCPICKELGLRSRVYGGQVITSTLMAYDPGYWNEDGRWVRNPDPNTHTSSYRCSNGHRWKVARREGSPDQILIGDE